MRLGFCGSPSFAAEVLDALIDAGHDVAVVVSRPDRPRGRGSRTTPTAVKAAAMRHGIAVTDDVTELAAAGLGLDLGIVVAYGAMVPASVLDRTAMLNLHFSLLPRWRGAAPVERAILSGDERTGVCVMGLEATLDTGPIYASASTAVGDKDLDALRTELVTAGTALLIDLLARDGLPTPTPQAGEPTYARKVTDDELVLDFTKPAAAVARVVRLGRARTTAATTRIVVRGCEVLDDDLGEPGSLHGDTVSCGRGALRLTEIVPEGRKAMPLDAWLRGLRGPTPTHLGDRTGP